MTIWLLCLLLRLPVGVSQPAAPPPFQKVLRFNVYTFIVKASQADSAETATVAAYRGSLLLTRFTQAIDGPLTGADVADLDGNRLPELYLYTSAPTSETYGRAFGWQFMPERLATITLPGSAEPPADFRGGDRFMLTSTALCHLIPIRTAAQPTGSARRICYRLRPAGADYQLRAD